jgi:hypothetical protein
MALVTTLPSGSSIVESVETRTPCDCIWQDVGAGLADGDSLGPAVGGSVNASVMVKMGALVGLYVLPSHGSQGSSKLKIAMSVDSGPGAKQALQSLEAT